jgi:hypothetical protein
MVLVVDMQKRQSLLHQDVHSALLLVIIVEQVPQILHSHVFKALYVQQDYQLRYQTV